MIITLCGNCEEKVPMKDHQIVDHNCEIIKSIKKQFNEALIGIQNKTDCIVSAVLNDLQEIRDAKNAINGSIINECNSNSENTRLKKQNETQGQSIHTMLDEIKSLKNKLEILMECLDRKSRELEEKELDLSLARKMIERNK